MRNPWPKSEFMFLKSLILGNTEPQTVVTKEKMDSQPRCLAGVPICSSTSIIVLECSLYHLFFKKPRRGREGRRWKWRERGESCHPATSEISPGFPSPILESSPQGAQAPPISSNQLVDTGARPVWLQQHSTFWAIPRSLSDSSPPPPSKHLSPFSLSLKPHSFLGPSTQPIKSRDLCILAGTILGLRV